MKNLLIFTLIVIAFTSCRKEEYRDEECANALINLCNNTTDKIFVYGWGTNYVTDTLFPGECELKDMGYFKVKYAWNGDIDEITTRNITLYSPGMTVSLGVTSCYWEYNPTSYIDIGHCYNGVFEPEEFEDDKDCGGNCRPCGELSFPCSTTLSKDQFKLSNRVNPFTSPSSFETGSVNNKKWIQFTFYNGEKLNFLIPRNQYPTASKRIIIGDNYWDTDVWFTDRYGYNRYDAVDSQSVYYIIDSIGNASLKFCDIDFKRNGSILRGDGYLTID